MTFRIRGHEEASGTKYVPKEMIEYWEKRDPILNYESFLLESDILNKKEIIYAKNESISSGNLKFIGTNETLLNKKTDSTNERRRPIDYLKFMHVASMRIP